MLLLNLSGGLFLGTVVVAEAKLAGLLVKKWCGSDAFKALQWWDKAKVLGANAIS